jgi:hypothetical protein
MPPNKTLQSLPSLRNHHGPGQYIGKLAASALYRTVVPSPRPPVQSPSRIQPTCYVCQIS